MGVGESDCCLEGSMSLRRMPQAFFEAERRVTRARGGARGSEGVFRRDPGATAWPGTGGGISRDAGAGGEECGRGQVKETPFLEARRGSTTGIIPVNFSKMRSVFGLLKQNPGYKSDEGTHGIFFASASSRTIRIWIVPSGSAGYFFRYSSMTASIYCDLLLSGSLSCRGSHVVRIQAARSCRDV